MPRDYCVIGAHLQNVVVAIREKASVKVLLVERMYAPRVVIYVQQIVTEYFEEPQLGRWDSPNSNAILHELFSSSHSTDAVMDLHWPGCVQCVGVLYLNNKYELYHYKVVARPYET